MSNNRCTVYTRAYTCVRVHRSRYKCHNRALCNSVDVLTTRVEFPSLPLRLSPPLPFHGRFISPSILRTMQRFAQQYTIRGFNPLRTRDSYQGSLRDDSLETVSFYLNTPVLIAPSCSFEFTHVSKFFFFFAKIYLIQIFNAIVSTLNSKFSFSLSFHDFQMLSHRDFKFFGFF